MRILVTGGNKGIGHAIILRLLKDKRVTEIWFTSRIKENAERAVQDFSAANLYNAKISTLMLDLLEQASRNSFIDELSDRKLTFDVIIQNAGVLFPAGINQKVVDITLQTNLFSPIELTDKFIDRDILKPNGKMVFVSSNLGTFSRVKKHQTIQEKLLQFRNPDFKVTDLLEVAHQYQAEIFDLKLSALWGNSVYAISKLLLSIYVMALTHESKFKGFTFYACCPGWCQTDLTKGTKAPLTAEEGSDTPVYLAFENLPEDMNGEFFLKRQRFDIISGN